MSSAFIETNAAEIAELMRTKERDTANALKGEAALLKTDMLADYKRTTSSWSHRVTFEAMSDTQADGSFSVMVGTDDRIYGYVDLGTRPHIILPKRARVLAFQGGYRAKTSPGVLGSSGGGKFGATIFARAVRHPGTKARGFTRMIFDKHKQLSLRRIARKLAEVWGG